MRKKSIVVLSVCLLTIAGSAWAQTQYVLDTGDPAERSCNPKSYTDLGTGIVRDNVTGLEWQQTSTGGRYSWQGALDYVADMNAGIHENYNYTDWRLPTIEELSTLVDSNIPWPGPTINIASFPDTVGSGYWSSTTSAYDTGKAWDVLFGNGSVGDYPKTDDYGDYVRAVRGGQYGSLDNLVINGDGTVTDTDTGLVWQQCNYGQTWSGTACTGSAATRTWDQAFEYVQKLNATHDLDYDDWRLPTRNELQSIINYSLSEPATTFPNTESYYYWSSTTVADDTSIAWLVEFFFGCTPDFISKTDKSYVRAVRGGSCVIPCTVDADCPDNSMYCDGVPFCSEETSTCVAGTPVECGDGQTCDEEANACVDPECTVDADCGDGDRCVSNACVPRCELTIKYKPPFSVKLTKPKKLKLTITGAEGFDPNGIIDLGPFQALKPKVNIKKGSLSVTALVPAEFPPGVVDISVGDCFGEIEVY